jgi:hypothetical protein
MRRPTPRGRPPLRNTRYEAARNATAARRLRPPMRVSSRIPGDRGMVRRTETRARPVRTIKARRIRGAGIVRPVATSQVPKSTRASWQNPPASESVEVSTRGSAQGSMRETRNRETAPPER